MNTKVTNQKDKTLKFTGINSFNTPVKTPGILSYITKHFSGYRSSESLIMSLILFIVQRYQKLDLDTFLGQELLDIDIDEFSSITGMSPAYLLKKTVNCDPAYTPLHVMELGMNYKGGIAPEVKEWTDIHRKNYKAILDSGNFLYDTVITDALYRMWKQRINNEEMANNSFVKKAWQQYYELEGFFILKSVKVLTESAQGGGIKISKIQIRIADELISQIHLFFFIIQSKDYQKLLTSSKRHSSTPKLFLLLSYLRHIHFFNTKDPKKEEDQYRIEFHKICDHIGLRFREKEGDKSNWRYKNARKSLQEKLQDILDGSDILTSFTIQKISRSVKYPNVILYFKKPNEEQRRMVEEFLKERETIAIQKWLSISYKDQLKPGSHPWDPSITNERAILEEYCNQKYFTQWLAHDKLHISEKNRGLKAAYTELFPDKEQSQRFIEKRLEETTRAAKQRLLKNDQPLLEARDWNRDNALIELERLFALAFKGFLGGAYITRPIPAYFSLEYLKTIPVNAVYLYVFLKSDDFNNKDMPTYIKSINNVQFKASKYDFKADSADGAHNIFWNYCRFIIQEDNLLQHFDPDRKTRLEEIKAFSFDRQKHILTLYADFWDDKLINTMRSVAKQAGLSIKIIDKNKKTTILKLG